MTLQSIPSRGPRRQLGFTLVELMVAVALGLLVMVALVAVYLNVSRTNSEMYKTNGLIENGRFAIDVLNEDLTHAGYWGGYVPKYDNFSLRAVPTPCTIGATAPCDVPDAATLALGPCVAYGASWSHEYRAMLMGMPVQVYGDGAPTGCIGVVDRKPGTDVLVVRHADTCAIGEANCDAYDASKVYFQASQCAIETDAGWNYDFGKRATLADFTLKKRGCTGTPPATVGTQAEVRKFVSSIYYIRSWAASAGDGVPTLVRASFGLASGLPAHEPAQALIEGIESFRVELGLDQAEGRCPGSAVDYATPIQTAASATLVNPATCATNLANLAVNTLPINRGDGVPESYVHCAAGGCTAAQLLNVVSAKIYLVARSKEPSKGHVDTKEYTLGAAGPASVPLDERGYKRHLFQTTVRMANISARRETP